jgi:radical SAM protein with 4Fe4S-binding SPASM domain
MLQSGYDGRPLLYGTDLQVLNYLFAVHDLIPKEHRTGVRQAFERVSYYGARVRSGRDVFTEIEIETNTNCNRKCRICPRQKHEREVGFMPADLYSHLLDQLASMKFRGRFSPVFYNEPLMDTRLAGLMREAKTKLPKTNIVVFTNGSLLTQENIEALVAAGVDTLLVSQYEGNLRADEEPYLDAVKHLSEDVRRKIRYRTLGDEDFLSSSGGLVRVKKPVTKTRCIQASQSCVVDFRGDVVLCCNDYYGKHTFGNVRDEHILDIWNKPHFVKLRKELRHGDFQLEICKTCAAGGAPASKEKT